jgi:ABC-2 type transport system ATP-binding protein
MAVMERGQMVVSGQIDEVRDRLSEGLVVAIEILSGVEAFRSIIAADEHSGRIEERPGGVILHYRGTRQDAADLLARLIQAGVQVVSFAPHKEGLEELFLKIGAKELA